MRGRSALVGLGLGVAVEHRISAPHHSQWVIGSSSSPPGEAATGSLPQLGQLLTAWPLGSGTGPPHAAGRGVGSVRCSTEPGPGSSVHRGLRGLDDPPRIRPRRKPESPPEALGKLRRPDAAAGPPRKARYQPSGHRTLPGVRMVCPSGRPRGDKPSPRQRHPANVRPSTGRGVDGRGRPAHSTLALRRRALSANRPRQLRAYDFGLDLPRG